MAKKTDEGEKPETNKTDAVRAALAEGIDMPEAGVAFIKDKFGLDVTRAQFSSYKSLAKKSGKSGAIQTPRTAAGVSGAAAVPKSNGPASLAIQVEAIKALVDTLGAEQVVSIARLFGK